MRYRNHGLRKKCGCPRTAWPTCPHSFHFNFKPRGGRHWRFSLDAEIGRHIGSTTEAQHEPRRIRNEILDGTFVRAQERSAVATQAASQVEGYTVGDVREP